MGVHVFPILNPLPPPSPYHPSGSSQCTSSKHPVSCIKPGLAIHFLCDIIHVSMPFSQIILPPQSPKDCSIHLCLFCCLAYRVIVTIFLNSIYMHSYWCFSFWLTSFCMLLPAAKLLQSCPTLCNPIDSSPPGSPVPGILQARTSEWSAISFSNA